MLTIKVRNLSFITKRPNVLNLALAGLLTFSLALTALTINSVRSLESEARGKPVRTTGTFSVSPTPLPLNSTAITMSGSGFKINTQYSVQLVGICCFQSLTTDSAGSFSYVYFHDFTYTGAYTAEIWAQTNKGPVQLNSAIFVVQ